jgi:hypothetical protein
MPDFLIETTNESGTVNQERVSANETVLNLSRRSLVRIVGLERATRLQRLNVRRPINAFLVSNLSRFLFLFVQLNANCFVDVPACVLALTQLEHLWVSLVLFVVVLTPLAALLEPLVVCVRRHWSNDGFDKPHRETDTDAAFALAVSPSPSSSSLRIVSISCHAR